MSELTKIRLNLSTGEIEIQGSQEFVEQQLDSIEEFLELVSPVESWESKPDYSDSGGSEDDYTEEPHEPSSRTNVPDTFGAWLHRFPRDLHDTDKALIAAYFVQTQSDDNEFKTSQVTKTLKAAGISLSNTSKSIQREVKKKHAFSTRRDGRIKYYRVSREGEDYLKSLQT